MISDVWTDKHRNVMRKLVVEKVGCYDIGWPDVEKCRGCSKRRRHKEAEINITARVGRRSEPDPRKTRQMGTKGPELRRRIGSGKEALRRTL